MWYNHLNDYLIKEVYQNDNICSYVFINSSINRFIMIAIYVNDLNFVRTPHEIAIVASYVKKEFEMMDL